MKIIMVFWIFLVSVIYIPLVVGQECATNPNKPLFSRMFLVSFKGDFGCCFNETTMGEALGECGSGLDLLAQDMFQFFESGYGLDLSAVKNKPYGPYESSQLSFYPFNTKQGEMDIVETEVFYEYANYLHMPMPLVGWLVSVNATTVGERGIIRPGQSLGFGMFRIEFPGGDFCMKVHQRKPRGETPVNTPSPIDFEVYNTDWGKGAMRGVSFNNGRYTDEKYLITFPAEPSNLG